MSCLELQHRRPDLYITSGKYLFLDFVVMHNGLGYRTGYVRIPDWHPWYKTEPEVDVHGGITYTDYCSEHNPRCWWIGFDCAHAYDPPDMNLEFDSPMVKRIMESTLGKQPGTVKTTRYVINECRKLCEAAQRAMRQSGGQYE